MAVADERARLALLNAALSADGPLDADEWLTPEDLAAMHDAELYEVGAKRIGPPKVPREMALTVPARPRRQDTCPRCDRFLGADGDCANCRAVAEDLDERLSWERQQFGAEVDIDDRDEED